MVIVDANSVELATTASGADARYSVEVPADAVFPLVVTASGGVDSVTAAPPRMNLVSVVVSADQSVANVSPTSSLLLEVANCIGGDMASALEQAVMNGAQALPALLGVTGLPNPISTAVSDDVGADVVVANEVLGEVLRRASVALGKINPDADDLDDVLGVLACDISDGVLDAQGPGLADRQRRIAAINVALGEVSTELLRGELRVGTLDATIALQAAVDRFFPNAPAGAVADRRADADIVMLARQAIQTAIELSPSAELIALSRSLDLLEGGESMDEVRMLLPAGEVATMFRGAQARVSALLDSDPVFALASRAGVASAQQFEASSFSVFDGDSVLDLGATTTLVVTAPGFVACRVGSDVAGVEDAFFSAELVADVPTVVGGLQTEPLNQASQTYTLECVGNNRAFESEVVITPEPAEVISFTASADQVDLNGTVDVSWSTRNAVSCEPSGDFAGVDVTAVNTTGAAVPSIAATEATLDFSLVCMNLAGATVPATLSVDTNPPVITRFAPFDPILTGAEEGFLSWDTSNAVDCVGSEDAGPATGFAGVRPTSFGDGLDVATFFSLGTIDRGRTFTLTCNGAIGLEPAVAQVNVDTQGAVLSWSAPTRLSNGADLPLEDIVSYRVYVTQNPEGPYDEPPIVVAADGAEMSTSIALEPGTYFFAVTAVLGDGSESAFSAEVSKVVQAAE